MRFTTALLTWVCGSTFQMVCKATFNSSVVLGFGWSFTALFQHGSSDVIVQCVQIWSAGMISIWTRSCSVSSGRRSNTEEWGLSWVKRNNFVTFQLVSTKLDDKVYILLLNSHVKFHAKICTHCWNIDKSRRRGLLFSFTRYTCAARWA